MVHLGKQLDEYATTIALQIAMGEDDIKRVKDEPMHGYILLDRAGRLNQLHDVYKACLNIGLIIIDDELNNPDLGLLSGQMRTPPSSASKNPTSSISRAAMEISEDEELEIRLFLPYESFPSDSRKHLKDKTITSLTRLYHHYGVPVPRSLMNTEDDRPDGDISNVLHDLKEHVLTGAKEPYLDTSRYFPLNIGMLVHLLNSPDLPVGLRSLCKAVYERTVRGELKPGDDELRDTALHYFEIMKTRNFTKALEGGRRLIASMKKHDDWNTDTCRAFDKLQLVCRKSYHGQYVHRTQFTDYVRDVAPINFATSLNHLLPLKFHYEAKKL
ncbi:hypothetical protein E1189_21595 [Sansalvadorimonas verongulae]|nr:hypothetical protein [Sansalvadorimonas verongulae]